MRTSSYHLQNEATLLIIHHLTFKAGTGITQCPKPGSTKYVGTCVYALYVPISAHQVLDSDTQHQYKVRGDGNCLFRALCYVITGSERQHFKLRSLIIEHLRSTDTLYCRAYNRALHCTFTHGSAGYMGLNNRNTSASAPSRNKHSLIQLS